jgi:hypothetical protein
MVSRYEQGFVYSDNTVGVAEPLRVLTINTRSFDFLMSRLFAGRKRIHIAFIAFDINNGFAVRP